MSWPHLAVAMFAAAAGCSRRAPPRDAAPDSPAVQTDAGGLAADGAPGGGAGPVADTIHAFEGTWDLAAVGQRLASVGLDPRSAGPVRQPFMAVPGSRFLVRGMEVQVFLYGDAAARARDTDPLDSSQVGVPGGGASATLVTSNNVAALMIGGDAALRQQVRAALQLGGRARDEP